MKPEIESNIIKSNRLNLKGLELFWHYSPAIFFLILPITDLFLMIESKFKNDIEGFQRMIEGQELGWIFLIISILVFFYKWTNLRFKEINLIASDKSFNEAIRKTAQQLEWKIIKETSNFLIAKSHHNLGSWGEHITIIKQENNILINSICDPEERPAISSWGGNNKNIKCFIKNIKQFTKSNDSKSTPSK